LRLQLIGGTISDIARKEQMTYDKVETEKAVRTAMRLP
jgi:hypothetical protein